MANCCYKLGLFDDAVRNFKKCIEYCPDCVQAYINYAHLLADMGDSADAQRKARSAYLLDKDSAYVNFAVGVVYLKLKMYDDALEEFEHSLILISDYSPAYLGIAEVD